MTTSTKAYRMQLALAELKQQKKPNVSATSKKYQLVQSTLYRRWKGETMSHAEASSEFKQHLTKAQEEILIQRINQLSDCGLPPSPAIVYNLAEEILQGLIGKNWATRFRKRYSDRLKSIYLRNIDSQRVRAEYTPLFEYFFALVLFILILFR